MTLFCAGLRRDVYERVGPLDERFGLGMFEDDDYVTVFARPDIRSPAQRTCWCTTSARHLGWLARTGSYGALFAENRRRYDEKWATSWRPHRQRRSPAHALMIERTGAMVERLVPPGANVLVVSKGDDALLQLAGRHAEHFPQDDSGAYVGYHPADASSAIAELDRLRADGASHLLIPRPSLWWLDHYQALHEHLNHCGSLLGRDEDAGALYALEPGNRQPTDRRAA